MKTRLSLLLSLLALFAAASVASAHEFIVKPQAATFEVGQKIPVSVVSAHVFMQSEELEPGEFVKVSFNGKPVALKANDATFTWDGAVEPVKPGANIIAGHREGVVWSKTTKGWKAGSRKDLKGVVYSGRFEKFCKTLLPVGGEDAGFDAELGQKLEIVPLNDPFAVKPGGEVAFKVLYDGKPLSTQVFATYDGFSDNANTYAYFTECADDGVAKVKITHPGLWMVRVQHKVPGVKGDYDEHVMRSVIVFPAGI